MLVKQELRENYMLDLFHDEQQFIPPHNGSKPGNVTLATRLPPVVGQEIVPPHNSNTPVHTQIKLQTILR